MPFKTCPKCNVANGVRTLVCKGCQQPFGVKPQVNTSPPKVRKKKGLMVDWHDLKVGDRIRVIGKTGPYYLGEDDTKTYLTERGIYTIVGLDKLGLICHNAKMGGDHFIYMGPKKRSPLGRNIWRKRCKIRLL